MSALSKLLRGLHLMERNAARKGAEGLYTVGQYSDEQQVCIKKENMASLSQLWRFEPHAMLVPDLTVHSAGGSACR